MKLILVGIGGFGSSWYERIKLLSQGSIGAIVTVNVVFYRCNIDREGRYLSGLRHPLLEDVAIHHFDLMRYVTESDPSGKEETERLREKSTSRRRRWSIIPWNPSGPEG